jgi:hypothetical protein
MMAWPMFSSRTPGRAAMARHCGSRAPTSIYLEAELQPQPHRVADTTQLLIPGAPAGRVGIVAGVDLHHRGAGLLGCLDLRGICIDEE